MMRLRGDLQQRSGRGGNARLNAASTPYDGRVFSAWMLGGALVMGNSALLFVMWPGVVLPAWLAIIVSWCIWRSRRRIVIGLVGGVLMLWPLALL